LSTRFYGIGRALDKSGLTLPRHVVESISIHIQYGMVLYGSMLTFGLRSQIAFSPAKDFLVRLPVDLPPVAGAIGAVTLRARRQSPLVHQLLGHIRGVAATLQA
jgi:DNA-binding transcriptional LysR family regulator